MEMGLHPSLQCTTTSGLKPKSSVAVPDLRSQVRGLEGKSAYLAFSKADEISAGLDKSSLSVAGGLARVKPVPTT